MIRSNSRFWTGATWGLVGTFAMTIAMLLVTLACASVMPEPVPLAITVGIIVRIAGLASASSAVVVLAVLVHFAYGALWAGLLAVSTPRVTLGKGLAVGVGLWVLMMIFYVPMAGSTVFAVATRPAMWISTLVFHLIYGGTVGLFVDRHQHATELGFPASGGEA